MTNVKSKYLKYYSTGTRTRIFYPVKMIESSVNKHVTPPRSQLSIVSKWLKGKAKGTSFNYRYLNAYIPEYSIYIPVLYYCK